MIAARYCVPVRLVAVLVALACGHSRAAAEEPCPRAGALPGNTTDPFAGYIARVQTGHALPKEGVFDLVLRPAANVVLPVRVPGGSEHGYAASVTIERVPAGPWRIHYTGEARLDVVQNHVLMPTLTQIVRGGGCPAAWARVDFSAEAGPLTIQVSNATVRLMRIAVERVWPSEPRN